MFGITRQGNDLDPIRDEAVDILRMQYKRGNNGYVKTKYVTLTIEAENLPAARARFARIETDTLNRFKVMGAAAHVLDGKERLELLYNILHPEGGQFAFEWDWLPASGLSVKDFISPSSFHFGETRTFRIGKRYGAVSFLQILAPEMHDRILTDFMEADGNIMVTMHIRGINQNEAIKMVKRKITEIYRALELEKRYEKDEILEAYLNEVYFGQRCSGVMTAARVYFGKDVSELTLAECASMMGITNNPSMYDPFISSWTRENNRERQLTILSEMLSQGKIDQEEYDAAVAEDIQFANGFTISGKYVGSDGTGTEPDTEDTTDTSDDTDSPADDSTPTIKGSNSWFTDAMITDVAEALVEKLGITEKVNSEGKKVSAYDQAINMVYSRGYKIYTTQNPKYQKIAEDVCYNLENIPYTSSYTNAAGELSLIHI